MYQTDPSALKYEIEYRRELMLRSRRGSRRRSRRRNPVDPYTRRLTR
jgi:hypothetical protein